jgi:nucleotide-binding universal stress UspA family protein
MTSATDVPVIAAVSGKHMDAAVVNAAGLRAQHGKQPLVLLHVIEVDRAEPVDASDEDDLVQAEQVIAEAERMVPKNGVDVRTEIKQARSASAAIVDTAVVEGADTIVVGAHRFLGEHECDLGRTATHVLRHAPVAVIVCYEPIR